MKKAASNVLTVPEERTADSTAPGSTIITMLDWMKRKTQTEDMTQTREE